MRRFVLLEVNGAGLYEVAGVQGSPVTLRCEGSASQCLLAAAEEMASRDLYDVRLNQLPALNRRLGIAERELTATPEQAAAAPTN